MKITLLAKSSSGEPYKVEFSTSDSDLKIFCHCQAGVLHRMCKHKQAFIDGNATMLFDPNQLAQLSEIHSWPEFKNLLKKFEGYSKQLAEIESAKRQLDKTEKQIKAELGKGLSFGFKN
jgi:hypothetical protein